MTKRIMTDEARKALLKVLPISESGYTFTPNIYPEQFIEYAPKVTIRALTFTEKMEQENSEALDVTVIKYSYKALLDIENLFDASTGEEIGIKKVDGKIDYDWYSKLPVSLLYAIYLKVVEISSLVPAEKESLG